jgi:hypothetical protein
MVRIKINKTKTVIVTMTNAKANAQTNDSFIYNKHLGNIYLG